jgi:hypothetical protein
MTYTGRGEVMNIFHVDTDPEICAKQMCDKHVLKMVIETAQLLSTTHRVVDGYMYEDKTKNNRNIKRWHYPEKEMETKLYKSCHVNHPSTIWTRESSSNYAWLYTHFVALCDEYTHRYGKVHATDTKLRNILSQTPQKLLQGEVTELTEFKQCMPDYCKRKDPVEAYRVYYMNEKRSFARWTKRNIPSWYISA